MIFDKTKFINITTLFLGLGLISCSSNKVRELSEDEKKVIVEQAVQSVVHPVLVYSKTDINSEVLTKAELKDTRFLKVTCECDEWVGIPLTNEEEKSEIVGFIKKNDLSNKNIIIVRPETGILEKCQECNK